MPSCDPTVLKALAQHLLRAAQAQDWDLVQQLDTRVLHWLEVQKAEQLTAMQQSAWRELAVAHASAMQACMQARQLAAAQLQDLNTQQEAHKAYAWQEVLG